MSTRSRLTDASVRALSEPRMYWDDELRGFGVIVRASGKTFIVQKDVRGRSVRVTIGRFPAWGADTARKHARELVVEMDKGGNPNERKRLEAARGATLADAVAMHLAAMRAKGCSERSTSTLSDETTRHLPDWLGRPIVSITRDECASRHGRITEASGPYVANRTMRHFRACYRTLARRTDLPPCPTSAVTMNRAKRKRQPIPWDGLPEWREAVEAIGNPVRRDFQFFVLFTGLRSLDARTVRFEEVDFGRGTIHRPCPKGGADRAFTLPVSDFVLGILRRRQEENRELYPDDGGWAFPTRDSKGRVTHVQEAKEQRYLQGRKVGHLPSPHRLRDTFASAAHEAGVDWFSLKTLMNHSLSDSGDVTAGYVRPDGEHLRGCAERVSAFFVERLWPKGYALVPNARTSAG